MQQVNRSGGKQYPPYLAPDAAATPEKRLELRRYMLVSKSMYHHGFQGAPVAGLDYVGPQATDPSGKDLFQKMWFNQTAQKVLDIEKAGVGAGALLSGAVMLVAPPVGITLLAGSAFAVIGLEARKLQMAFRSKTGYANQPALGATRVPTKLGKPLVDADRDGVVVSRVQPDCSPLRLRRLTVGVDP
jgi:hypothetical protein